MKKVILTISSLLVVFSASSYAQAENYFAKKAATESAHIEKINKHNSDHVQFETKQLNTDPRITH